MREIQRTESWNNNQSKEHQEIHTSNMDDGDYDADELVKNGISKLFTIFHMFFI